MASILLLAAIVALLLLGVVILFAVTLPQDVTLVTPASRGQRSRRAARAERGHARQASPGLERRMLERTAELRSHTATLVAVWWPRLRDRADAAWDRRPAPESTVGQVVAVLALSIVCAYLVVRFP